MAEQSVAEILRNADQMREAYEDRLRNQRRIIDRYDGYRRWVITKAVPSLEAIHHALRTNEGLLSVEGQRALDLLMHATSALKTRGENPPEPEDRERRAQ